MHSFCFPYEAKLVIAALASSNGTTHPFETIWLFSSAFQKNGWAPNFRIRTHIINFSRKTNRVALCTFHFKHILFKGLKI